MKNFMVLLLGIGIGVGGTLFWLRKDIKKQIQEMENTKKMNENDSKEGDYMPFSMENPVVEPPKEPQKQEKIAYNNIPLEEKDAEISDSSDDIQESDETDGGIFEIDVDEMMHNHEYEKERLVYFRGDKIMATESGTIISNPFLLVGGEWENCVGNYAENTAFIRNPKMVTDYEIYVEDGLYADEYGDVGSDFED